MKLLILGGTVFLGRHIVDAALARGHAVSIFHRGEHAMAVPEEVEELLGNRDATLDVLDGKTWDAVIDTSGYVPRQVRSSASFLADRVSHYTFISTISVYTDELRPGMDETAPLATLADPTTEEVTGETYGGLKVLCEQALQEMLPDRALIIRPGLIVGPYDKSDRFTYWPWRVAQGGEVLAPDAPTHPVQIIDARDLATWTVQMSEAQQTGIFNATGPKDHLTIDDVLTTCQAVTGSDAQFTWVSETFLGEHNVAPYTEMPLWVPMSEVGFDSVSIVKAIAAGLTFRTLAETVRDTLAWVRTARGNDPLKAGLTLERERELLVAWKQVS